MELSTKIKQRKDTLANWESANPVLLSGEIAFIVMPDGRTLQKIGDGLNTFNLLPYVTQPYANIVIPVNESVSITVDKQSAIFYCTNNSVITLTLPDVNIENGWSCSVELASSANNVTISCTKNIIYNGSLVENLTLGAPNNVKFIYDGNQYHILPSMLQTIK